MRVIRGSVCPHVHHLIDVFHWFATACLVLEGATMRPAALRILARPDAGTNVMLRARACFLACKFGKPSSKKRGQRTLESQRRSRQLFSETLVAEDVDLGSRIHALGFRAVFLDEVLARGEVRPAPLCYLAWHRQRLTSRSSTRFRVSPMYSCRHHQMLGALSYLPYLEPLPSFWAKGGAGFACVALFPAIVSCFKH